MWRKEFNIFLSDLFQKLGIIHLPRYELRALETRQRTTELSQIFFEIFLEENPIFLRKYEVFEQPNIFSNNLEASGYLWTMCLSDERRLLIGKVGKKERRLENI